MIIWRTKLVRILIVALWCSLIILQLVGIDVAQETESESRCAAM